MSAGQSNKKTFIADASLILQLGETLIRDDIQAIMELVKNSYDADATTVRLIIDTESVYPGASEPGYIAIIDDGRGMDETQITRGWLTLSNSLKREMKRLGLTSARGRTPLGDKGLGRLSAQRLGRRLLIETVPETGDRRYRLNMDWTMFRESKPLESVPLEYIDEPRGNGRTGTTLVVTDLLDVDRWRELRPEQLRVRLAEIVSPYGDIAKFRIRCRFKGRRIDPSQVTKNVRNAAHLRYKIEFDGDELRAEGFIRPEYIAANLKEDDLLVFRETVEVDGGKRFLRFLTEKKAKLLFDLRMADSGPWMFQTSFRKAFADAKGIRPGGEGQAVNPGPFSAEVDAFNLGNEGAKSATREFEVFSRVSEFKKFVAEMSGVRVYRDGFAIRVDPDWLQLGKQWTKGGSWYSLKPSNTLGYVAISARHNPLLQETTDREGFVDSIPYQNFYQLLQEFLKYTADSQEQLRRGWNLYKTAVQEEVAGVRITSPAAVAETVSQGLEEVQMLSTAMSTAVRDLKTAVEVVQKPEDAPELALYDSKSTAIADAVSVAVRKLEDSVAALGSLEERRAGLRLLAGEVEALRTALAETYELVSLGLTAESLSHEISQIADRLARLTSEVEVHVVESGLADAKVRTYIEQVKDALSGLDKQMSHLDPALKYVREKKIDIQVPYFLREVEDYYAIRFAGERITLAQSGDEDFTVRINKGKLIQVMDNLILNSEYWLRGDLKAHRMANGVVTLRAESPYILISDNGRGVEPGYEHSIFDMFVTTKPPGEGRGLGLYIVSQLLDADGCSISLLPDRNQYGRRYRFRIDLSGALTAE